MGSKLTDGQHGMTYTGTEPPPRDPHQLFPGSRTFTVSDAGWRIVDQHGSEWWWHPGLEAYIRAEYVMGEVMFDTWEFDAATNTMTQTFPQRSYLYRVHGTYT